MNEYRVYDPGGTLVLVYQHTSQLTFPQYPGSTQTVTPVVPTVDTPTPPVQIKITKLAFRARFTATEKITIELASLDVPDGSLLARQAAAQMRVWLEDIDAAQFIDLNYQPTRDGVQALEDYGLIGAGRATEILDTLPASDEVFNG